MARFFKFRDLDDIRAESARLGLSLRFDEDLSPLFRPIAIGPLRVGSRLCIHPMEGCDAGLDGQPGELTFRRWRRFGAGGAKLVWGEAAAVVPEGRANTRQLLMDDDTAPAIGRLLAECRQAHREAMGAADGLAVGLQLTHSGRYSHRRALVACECPLLDARTRDPRMLSDDDLERLIDRYVHAAKLAQAVGFDFVDVKQCHRYLLNELLGARTRPGRFGGEYANRTRFARTVLERVRDEVPGLVMATRLSLHDGTPHGAEGADGTEWGMPDLSEPLRWIGDMKAIGVAMVNASMGNPYASPHLLRPFEQPPPDGYETPEHPLVGVDRHVRLTAEAQLAHADVPVVGSGYSWLQEFFPQAGAANVADGRIAFVGVGRGALSMPDFAKLLMEGGALDRRRVCRTFSYCTALMRSKHNEMGQFATGCPPFDKEAYGALWDLARKKP